jgi:DNA-directed RNA polymerase specialized sigma24 family protein
MTCPVRAPRESPASGARCREAADRLLARYGWCLLGREELTRRAEVHLSAGVAADARRAAIHAYCLALYDACSGRGGRERQERGYAELHRYLYDSARARYPDVCDDATQRALEHIFASFDRCRQPGAFLAFALQHLLDAARAVRRQEAWRGPSLSLPAVEDGDQELGNLLPDPRQPDPVAAALDDERRARLARHAADYLRAHPRARDQLAALWLKYIEGLDDEAIGRRLGKTVNNVYILRSRAVARLQSEPGWREFASECGVMFEHPVPARADERAL